MNLSNLHELVRVYGLEKVEDELNAIAANGVDEGYLERVNKVNDLTTDVFHTDPKGLEQKSVDALHNKLAKAEKELKEYVGSRWGKERPKFTTAKPVFFRHSVRAAKGKADELLDAINKAVELFKAAPEVKYRAVVREFAARSLMQAADVRRTLGLFIYTLYNGTARKEGLDEELLNDIVEASFDEFGDVYKNLK